MTKIAYMLTAAILSTTTAADAAVYTRNYDFSRAFSGAYAVNPDGILEKVYSQTMNIAGFDTRLGNLTSITFGADVAMTSNVKATRSGVQSGDLVYRVSNGLFVNIVPTNIVDLASVRNMERADLTLGAYAKSANFSYTSYASDSFSLPNGDLDLLGGFQILIFGNSSIERADSTPGVSGTVSGTSKGKGVLSISYTYSLPGAPVVRPTLSRGMSLSTMPASFAPLAAVPEPATWAMMLAGFGAVGIAARRRRAASARA